DVCSSDLGTKARDGATVVLPTLCSRILHHGGIFAPHQLSGNSADAAVAELGRAPPPRSYAPAMPAIEALFVVDPPSTFNPRADSTFVMVTEALRRGHRPFGAELTGLSLEGDQASALVAPLELHDGRLRAATPPQRRPLSEFAVVLMRKDPPVDQAYMTATWILEHAGTLVLNRPRGLRELNEKLAILP